MQYLDKPFNQVVFFVVISIFLSFSSNLLRKDSIPFLAKKLEITEDIDLNSDESSLLAISLDKAKDFFNENQIIIDNVDKRAYLSSLQLADHIIVTCDSTSMISEAAITSKPIYVAHMPHIKNNDRFKKFFDFFEKLNIIRDLEDKVEDWKYEKLNETDRISGYIKGKIKNNDIY